MSEPLLTVDDVAERFNCSPSKVRTACRAKRGWPHLRIGGSIRFTEKHVNLIQLMLNDQVVNVLNDVPRLANVFLSSGIYFLLDVDEVVYVGKAKIIAKRVGTHIEERKKVFDSVRAIAVPFYDLDREEARWIRLFEPKYNIAGNDWFAPEEEVPLTPERIQFLRAASVQAVGGTKIGENSDA